ncbi:hypothetical protein DFP73DRAFT_568849 [Morchella snyderi]|nr:hypothetical protein DFP73DRAFT_568849 [Morchella snyderi]
MSSSTTVPRIFIIGAGSRGSAYAWAIKTCTPGTIVGVAEPVEFKRDLFASKHALDVSAGLVFEDWKQMIATEEARDKLKREVDGICVCTLDDTHCEIVLALRPLNIHILCEKPLSTTLDSCVQMCRALTSRKYEPIIFAIGHVLRYSPHNMLLRKLLCEDKVIGEIVNINHTEPVGWWHFAHSYVRGNWRKTSTSAPSLLTKCCHDTDLLLWLLCSPSASARPHLPSSITSSGSLVHFKPSQKPPTAGSATNCYSCPAAETDCIFSAKKIYDELNLAQGIKGWPVKIVVPEIEEAPSIADAQRILKTALEADYSTDKEQGDKSYYGRCVYEAGNDVVDNQVVTMTWDDDGQAGRGAKTATLTMIAFSKRICERFTRVYGTLGEVEADSNTIKVHDFRTGQSTTYKPWVDMTSGHGGGDGGLVGTFVRAIMKVGDGWTVEEAQNNIVGVTVDDVLRSHAVVFAAEEARLGRKVVDWDEWWNREVGQEA